MTLSFTFLGQLGSLITSRHAFRSSWNFQKLMQVRYIYFWLKDISGFENFLSKIRGLIKLNKKTMSNVFFQFLMLNISSIKELLHKSSEIQWNITETLPRKLKRKISWALSYKILPPEITKTWEIAILGGTLGAWELMWNSMVCMILWISENLSLYLLVKNSFNFVFFLFFFHLFWLYFREYH